VHWDGIDDDLARLIKPTLGSVTANRAARGNFDPHGDAIDGDLAASFVFGLKYERPGRLAEWWKELLAIENPKWRLETLACAWAIRPFLEGRWHLGDANGFGLELPLMWELSHFLERAVAKRPPWFHRPFIEAERAAAFLLLLNETVSHELVVSTADATVARPELAWVADAWLARVG
jgi:hypothetical protein